jgi:hypothetical protein
MNAHVENVIGAVLGVAFIAAPVAYWFLRG